LPKIMIKGNEIQLSDVASAAVLAERTDFNREIATLKDSLASKEEELKALKDSSKKHQKKLKKIEREKLRDSVIAKVKELDGDFKTKEKDPYKIMADVAGVEDGKSNEYVLAFFDSYIEAKISSSNDKNVNKKKKKKVDDSKKVLKKYYEGGKQ